MKHIVTLVSDDKDVLDDVITYLISKQLISPTEVVNVEDDDRMWMTRVPSSASVTVVAARVRDIAGNRVQVR